MRPRSGTTPPRDPATHRAVGTGFGGRWAPAAAAMPSPHDILGVPPDADAAEIRRVYRKRALELHPDHNDDPGAGEAFIALKRAYDELRDPDAAEARLIDAVVSQANRAAAEADRRRARPAGDPIGDPWRLIQIPIARPADWWRRRSFYPTRARIVAALGLGVALASLAGLAAGVSVVAVALGLAAAGVAFLTAFAQASRRGWAVHLGWRGLHDLRWHGTNGYLTWDEVVAIHTPAGRDVMDLQLSHAAADRMSGADGPGDALVYSNDALCYRLRLGRSQARARALVWGRGFA